MELRDEQNEEMAQLVQGISESDVGVDIRVGRDMKVLNSSLKAH